jgi:hypothetical protein
MFFVRAWEFEDNPNSQNDAHHEPQKSERGLGHTYFCVPARLGAISSPGNPFLEHSTPKPKLITRQ